MHWGWEWGAGGGGVTSSRLSPKFYDFFTASLIQIVFFFHFWEFLILILIFSRWWRRADTSTPPASRAKPASALSTTNSRFPRLVAQIENIGLLSGVRGGGRGGLLQALRTLPSTNLEGRGPRSPSGERWWCLPTMWRPSLWGWDDEVEEAALSQGLLHLQEVSDQDRLSEHARWQGLRMKCAENLWQGVLKLSWSCHTLILYLSQGEIYVIVKKILTLNSHTHHRRKERYSAEPATFTSSFPPGGFSLALRALYHFIGAFLAKAIPWTI